MLIASCQSVNHKTRTAQAKQVPGLLAEYGIIIPKGIMHVEKLPFILEENKAKLTIKTQAIVKRLNSQFKRYQADVKHYDKKIKKLVKQDVRCQEIMKIA